MDRFYDKETGINHFENVPEVAFEFYDALMAPKHSPFIERFNEILLRYVEAGIGCHHMRQAYADNEKFLIRRIKKGEFPKRSNGAIKLFDIWISLKIYLSMITLSVAIFVGEFLTYRLKFHCKR